MSSVMYGVVKNGVIVLDAPLPEGTRVEIHLQEKMETPPELQEEFDAWERAGAGTVELIERLAEEMENK